VGKTYEALSRSEKEALESNLLPKYQIHASDSFTTASPIEIDTPTSTDSEHHLLDDEIIYNIVSSESIKKELISNLDVGMIRDIFSYNYFLKLNDSIRVRQIKLYKYKKVVFYKLLLDTQIRVSLYLDRVGNFTSVNLFPETQKTIEQNSSIKPTLLERTGLKNEIQKMIQQVFLSLDNKKIETVFIDLFSIEHCQNLACVKGDIIIENGKLLYEFTIKSDVLFSLFLDFNGNFIGITFSKDQTIWKKIVSEHFFKESFFEINLLKK
jgi:hypothetical protein